MSIRNRYLCLFISLLTSGNTTPALAHDPVFGVGPHVLFKGGVEIAVEIEHDKAGDERETGVGLELTYGLTGDWAIGADLPYRHKRVAGADNAGAGDLALFTKYRFWRRDSLGLQESAAVLLKVKTNSARSGGNPVLNPGATDTLLGLAYGYEGRRWYRWASIRYRYNGRNDLGLKRGNMIKLDLVGGIRPTPTGYLEPDTVWLLELNGEYRQRSNLNGAIIANSGGNEWFISPGIFWTKRNFAIKAGIQIPVSSHLNGNQDKSDYRAQVTFEWHM